MILTSRSKIDVIGAEIGSPAFQTKNLPINEVNMTFSLLPSAFMMSMASNGVSNVSVDQVPDIGFDDLLAVYLKGGSTDNNQYSYEGFFPWANKNSLLYGGNWSVCWGPCVCKATNAKYATNAMYVASCDTDAHGLIYVVAIAATDPKSIDDWVVEDGLVQAKLQIAWPMIEPLTLPHSPFPATKAAISEATAIGISALMTMLDPQSGQTLQAFLASKVSSSARLIFAGHSLAGALAPTLAFHLFPTPATSGWNQVLVLPTAGATAGNTKFATDWIEQFGPTPDTTLELSKFSWNTAYVSQNDIVPHAWNALSEVVQPKDTNDNYPSIWGYLKGGDGNLANDVSVGGDVYKAVQTAIAESAGGNYTPITQYWFTPSWGYWDTTVYPDTWADLPQFTDADPMTSDKLGQVIIATHVDQYQQWFSTPPAPPAPWVTSKGNAS